MGRKRPPLGKNRGFEIIPYIYSSKEWEKRRTQDKVSTPSQMESRLEI